MSCQIARVTQSKKIKLTTHTTVRDVDAPWHYHPTMDNGVRAITIDRSAARLRAYVTLVSNSISVTCRTAGYDTVTEIGAELRRIGHTLKPLEIVVINTGAGQAYGDPLDYVDRGLWNGPRRSTLYLT